MLRLRRYGLLVLLVLPAGCGLYGEGGFSGKNPLPAPRFIENVDDACADVNQSLDDETEVLLRDEVPADDEAEDAVRDYRDAVDELVEELPEHYGPEELEQQRDAYVGVLEEVDEQLQDAREALEDGDEEAFRQGLSSAMERLAAAEKTLRTAGFEVCGVPRPAA